MNFDTVKTAHASFDKRWGKEMSRHKIKLSCGKGCSACCSEPTYAAKDEIKLALSELPKAELPGVVERTITWGLKASASTILSTEMPHVIDYLQLSMVCPFLKNNICLVYANRPFSCRSHCATGPAQLCASTNTRLSQVYAYSPELSDNIVTKLIDAKSEWDHVGALLTELLLGQKIKSEARLTMTDMANTIRNVKET